MGARFTCQLNSKEHNFISECVADILDDLTPLYKHHYCSHLLTHLRRKHTEPTEPRPHIQHTDVLTHGGIVIEETLPQCLDGIWTYCHLQVTSSFAVESRNAREVFKGGWGCKTELTLSGCHICTSVPEHRELVYDMCRHITGRFRDKLACWDCPTAFPVLIQHPYSGPVCLATASYEEQTRWANILRAATQHQSSVLWRDESPEAKAFLDAVSSLKKLRGKCHSEAHSVGDEEEVLIGIVMEEMIPYLKEEVFPRITAHRSRRRKAWIKLLSEVYETVKLQVKTAMVVLKEELSLFQSDMEERISAGLEQANLLQDRIAHTITGVSVEDMCEPVLQSLQHVVSPRLHPTLQEVAVPICDGFASIWECFLETCDNVIDAASPNTSTKDIKEEVLTLLSSFGPDNSRMWECLDRLELSSEGRSWLQNTWGVHSETWRPLLLKAQNDLHKVADMCAKMFWRLVSRYPCFSIESSQLTAVLSRVKDKVLKNLEADMLALRSEIILDVMLQITLPAFQQGVNEQNLSCYDAMISPEQALFIHPDIIFNSIMKDNLSTYIQTEMRYFLPQHLVPLPVSAGSTCSCSSDISEPAYHKLLPRCDSQETFVYASEGSSSESETLTPSSMSEREDTLRSSENSEKQRLLNVMKYIRFSEPRRSYRTESGKV
ncbi:protein Niban 1 isoform X2 [Kryptolebias marmoratus]|uniref:protein Niban 1 isoform X2 n=1 Tax=Kryptolebias marmoratus TaxID=37003 RepID=UPI0018ACEEAB|nr:protein Niban 1 isoform X2 [Kryptolebias marmoratus]